MTASGSVTEGTRRLCGQFDRAWTGVREPERIYGVSGELFVKTSKMQLDSLQSRPVRSLRHEFHVLRECTGIQSIPLAHYFIDADEEQLIVMERRPGVPLGQMEVNIRRDFIVMLHLSVVVFRLAWRGISHNDLRPDNLLVTRDGCVSLVDFDQATRGGFLSCLGASLLALGPLRRQVRSSLLGLARDQLQMVLPPRVLRLLRALVPRRVAASTPALALACDEATADRLRQAWRAAAAAGASSPGRAIAYYELLVGDVRLSGERSWAERWAYLRLATRWRGRRVLELGCNLALLSIFALKDEGAGAALAVDRDPAILEAAATVADALQVQPSFLRVDFDHDSGWEEALAAFRPDVVFALSVLNWVRDQGRLLSFLARFEEVVFEGHESGAVERRRLRAAGFRDIELICSSERGRPVFICRK